jgi:hypothetical protein
MQDVITVITHKCHNLTPTISKKRRLSLWPMAKWPRTACAGGEILAELPFFGASEDGIRVPGGAAVKVLVHGINIICYNIFYIIYIIYIYIGNTCNVLYHIISYHLVFYYIIL